MMDEHSGRLEQIVLNTLQIPHACAVEDWDRVHKLLSPSEQRSVDSIAHYGRRLLALVGKVFVRVLLANHSQTPLRRVCVARESSGRPYFNSRFTGMPTIHFSFAKSEQMLLCGISSVRLGVDIEKRCPVELKWYEDSFSEKEWQQINSAPEPQLAFFEAWTRKESVLKWDGRGLSLPLSRLELHRSIDEKWRSSYEGKILDCFTTNLPEFCGYSVAVCCSQNLQIQTKHWSWTEFTLLVRESTRLE